MTTVAENRYLSISRKKVHQLIVVLLSVICTWHIIYYLKMYLEDRKMTVTTAKFYGEQHQSPANEFLKLPRFALCFSKLFTYNGLYPSDIRFIYNHPNNSTLAHNKSHSYRWIPAIESTVRQVRFGSQVENSADIFEFAFYFAGISCWQTKENYSIFASQAGQVNMLQLIINAAVYDDLMVNYDSPMVYLYVIALSGKGQNVRGAFSNSIAISPGTFSSIGFQATKIDSEYRNKKDARRCDNTGNTAEMCVSNEERKMLRRECGIDVDNVVSSVSQFYSCGIKQTSLAYSGCHIEPCLYETYRFTKSESYIKFDRKLSVVNMSSGAIREIANDISKAKQLDSQLNPWRRNSFLELATGVDSLTFDIATYLEEPTGYKFSVLANVTKSLIKIDKHRIPRVKVELSLMKIVMNRFVQQSNKVLEYLKTTLLKYGLTNPCFQYAAPTLQLFGIRNAKPHKCCQDKTAYCYVPSYSKCWAYTVSSFEQEMHEVGQAMNLIVSAIASLSSMSVEITRIYDSLMFTEFIKSFSKFISGNMYMTRLQKVIGTLKSVVRTMFEGSEMYSGVFAFDEQHYRVDRRFQSQCSNLYIPYRNKRYTSNHSNHTKTFREVWHSRNWASIYVHHKCYYDINLLGNDIVVAAKPMPIIRRIPAFVDIVCRFYYKYLAAAERHFGSEPSFAIIDANAHFDIPQNFALFAINSILDVYDTSNLFYAGLQGLDDAIASSCYRAAAYPTYITKHSDIMPTSKKNMAECESTIQHSTTKATIKVIRLIRLISDSENCVRDYIKASNAFIEYYDRNIAKKFQPLREKVIMLRDIIYYYQKFKIKDAKHKIFLIKRLRKLAQLAGEAINGSGEMEVSRFLSRKGTILVGEIYIEMANLRREYFAAKAIYYRHKDMLRNIQIRMDRNSSIGDTIFNAIMSSAIHAKSSSQKEIVRLAEWCIHTAWKVSKERHDVGMRMFSVWVVNITAMVHRAKRYSNSLLVSKEFMRKNMMFVSLYYDSLQVLTETNTQAITPKKLFADVANVSSIYLQLTLFHILIVLIRVLELTTMVTKTVYRILRKKYRQLGSKERRHQLPEALKSVTVVESIQLQDHSVSAMGLVTERSISALPYRQSASPASHHESQSYAPRHGHVPEMHCCNIAEEE